MKEKWRPVVGFEGLYEVSNLGRARSLSRTVPHKVSGILTIKGRILRASPGTRHGYLMLSLSKAGKVSKVYLHDLVLAAFKGPKPKGKECRHLNGKTDDAALSNLRYSTHMVNMADMDIHNTHTRGEKNENAKLSQKQAERIRKSKKTQKELAAKYRVSQSTIQRIKALETYKGPAQFMTKGHDNTTDGRRRT